MPRLKKKKGCFKCEQHAGMSDIDVCSQNTTNCDSNLKNKITWASDEISLATFFSKKSPSSGGRIKKFYIELPTEKGKTIPLYCRLLKNETFKKEISKIQVEKEDVVALQVFKGSLFDGRCIVFLRDGWICSILLKPQDRGEKKLIIDSRYENEEILGGVRITILESTKQPYEIELQLFAGNAHYKDVLRQSTVRIGRLNNYINNSNNNNIVLDVVQTRKDKIISKRPWSFAINKINNKHEDNLDIISSNTIFSNNSNNTNNISINSNNSNNNNNNNNNDNNININNRDKQTIQSLENSVSYLQRKLAESNRIIAQKDEQINHLTCQLNLALNQFQPLPMNYNNNLNLDTNTSLLASPVSTTTSSIVNNNNNNNDTNSNSNDIDFSNNNIHNNNNISNNTYEYPYTNNTNMFPVNNSIDIQMNDYNNNNFNYSLNTMNYSVNFSTSSNTMLPMKRSREPDIFDDTMSLCKDPYETEINLDQINSYPNKKQNTGNSNISNNLINSQTSFPFP